MEKQQALSVLELDPNPTLDQIEMACAMKRAQILQKRESAPTDALKKKFDDILNNIVNARSVCLNALQQSEAAEKVKNNTGSEKTKSSGPRLSETKLNDLPTMEPEDIEQLTLQPGQVLAGRYDVKELIGQGGMGAVYRVYDRNRNEDIAIKVLLPRLTKNERALERFLNEARISSKLSHANIVNVFDVQNDGDLYFLTMELLEGQDLRQMMEGQRAIGRPFEIQDIKDYLNKICEALTAAHQYTVHRDIKPENIWLASDGGVKLMDFGIAQLQSTSQRTQTGAAMGTAYYMAPEQLKGLNDIDGRADQYAVAVLAYELLTGEVPAGAIEPVGSLRKDTPKAMAAAIMQALAPRPENRFSTIVEFNAALQSGQAPKNKRTTSLGHGVEYSSLKWPLVAACTVILLLVVGLFGSGTIDFDDIKKILPASKAEIAAQKAKVAKVEGEIKVYKQHLENSRRELDSDLKDAVRNKTGNLVALQTTKELTEKVVFSGNAIAELEGQLRMAETLVNDGAFEQAQVEMEVVRDGYQQLWNVFSAAEELFNVKAASAKAQKEWEKLARDYRLKEPKEAKLAKTLVGSAEYYQSTYDIVSAAQKWRESEQRWKDAVRVVGADVYKAKMQQAAQAKNVAEQQRKKVASLKLLNDYANNISEWEDSEDGYNQVYDNYKKSWASTLKLSFSPVGDNYCVLKINLEVFGKKTFRMGRQYEWVHRYYESSGEVDFSNVSTQIVAIGDDYKIASSGNIFKEKMRQRSNDWEEYDTGYKSVKEMLFLDYIDVLMPNIAVQKKHFDLLRLVELLAAHKGVCKN